LDNQDNMDLFHKLMELVDKNTDVIPEGDYLEFCDTIQELRQQVKPPSFLDQTIPMWRYDETNQRPPIYEPTRTREQDWAPQQLPSDRDIINGSIPDGQPRDWMDDELPSDPDTAAQRDRERFHQEWRERSGDEEVRYPGLNQFLNELHEEWSESVEPGAYYPPQDGTTVAEVTMMEVD
tara:strand:- start:458 stop:994 length:537 start_codon:yes stop_codon:yes gene_type:complete